uniref:Uncharacterized protein n=1 Tax=Rhizophora mucronata TaxID=61149 RepID=A0A2P2KBM2_RHIMU
MAAAVAQVSAFLSFSAHGSLPLAFSLCFCC